MSNQATRTTVESLFLVLTVICVLGCKHPHAYTKTEQSHIEAVLPTEEMIRAWVESDYPSSRQWHQDTFATYRAVVMQVVSKVRNGIPITIEVPSVAPCYTRRVEVDWWVLHPTENGTTFDHFIEMPYTYIELIFGLLSSDKTIDPPGVKTIDPPPGVLGDLRRPAKRSRRVRFQSEKDPMLMMASCQRPVWETRSVFQPKATGVERLLTRRAPRRGVSCVTRRASAARSAQRNPAGNPSAFPFPCTGRGRVGRELELSASGTYFPFPGTEASISVDRNRPAFRFSRRR